MTRKLSLLALVFFALSLVFTACPIQHNPDDYKFDDNIWVPYGWTGVVTGQGTGWATAGNDTVRITLGFEDGELIWAVFDPGGCSMNYSSVAGLYFTTMANFINRQSLAVDIVAGTTILATVRGITQATTGIINVIRTGLPASSPSLDDPPPFPPFFDIRVMAPELLD